jgi:branched-chain amino acid transport system substrate-binding protein
VSLLGGLLLVVLGMGPGQEPAPRPYKTEGAAPLEFLGPGRDAPEPEVQDVAIGWFGPSDPDHPDFGDFWRGALLGLAAVNAANGYHGKPFRLVPGWSDSPWAAGVVEVTRMAFRDHVWAVLGGVDGATTHLAEQVALKARFTLLSPGSTDGTANLANVPWMFSLLPSDERQAPVLASAVEEAADGGAFVVAAANDHDSHATLVAWRQALVDRHLIPATLLEFDARSDGPTSLAVRLLEARPRAVVVLAPSRPAADLVVALRRAGFVGSVLGGPALARRVFRREAGEAAEGVVVPRLWEPGPAWDAFAQLYENRWGEPPDDAAGQSFDAVRMVSEAVSRAGLNRPRLADAVRGLAPWSGAAGVVQWDTLGRNRRPVGLARWEGIRLIPLVTTEAPAALRHGRGRR